jgi:hypothetical protein
MSSVPRGVFHDAEEGGLVDGLVGASAPPCLRHLLHDHGEIFGGEPDLHTVEHSNQRRIENHLLGTLLSLLVYKQALHKQTGCSDS